MRKAGLGREPTIAVHNLNVRFQGTCPLVPTGLLGLLPLDAAWTEEHDKLDGRRYALDSITLCYSPNARALAVAQERADALTADRLLLCVEPQPVSAPPLCSSRDEAQAIHRLWPEESRTTRWHAAVTHEALEVLLPEHSVFHFVGHAFADWLEPRRGGLLLGEDKVFTIEEWQAVHLRIRLAVLSACETGRPGLRIPNEVIGLPAALVEAGAAGVVASLWSVSDESTAKLMERFYRLWREEGLPSAEALRRAQIELRENGFPHPYYWGAFTYTGA